MLGRRPRIALPIVVQAVLLGALGAKLVVCRGPAARPNCTEAIRGERTDIALVVCQAEYAETGNHHTGAQLAELYHAVDNPDAARATAMGLASTDVAAAEVQYVLGLVERDAGNYDDALAAFEEARRRHRDNGRTYAEARDELGIATVHRARGDHGAALAALASCARVAAKEHPAMVGYCELSMASMLIEVGRDRAAHKAFDRAYEHLRTVREAADVYFARANLLQEVAERDGGGEAAVRDFRIAQLLGEWLHETTFVRDVRLNLAFTLAELGRTVEAEHHLEAARGLRTKDRKLNQIAQLEARIAYRRGRFAQASAQNTELYAGIISPDEKIDVCVMQARIEIARSNLDAAADWAERGAAVAEEVRRAQPVELRSWELARRRLPAELLFSIHAWAGRPTEAVLALDLWHGRSLVDQIRVSERSPTSAEKTASQVADVEAWTTTAVASPLTGAVAREEVLATLRQIDLLALVVADGWVWRVGARAGDIQLSVVGTLRGLMPALREIRSDPTSALVGDWLGAQVIGDDLGRLTTQPLHVLLDPSLTSLPVAALRVGGQPLIARRPVVRTLRLPRTACVPPATGRTMAALADAKDNLPAARAEALALGERFGDDITVAVGKAANRRALFAATGVRALHLALHGTVDPDDGGMLELADVPKVSALELAARKLGPPLVVLAACSSAASNDPERATALATGFLMAGSQQVVATLQNVYDKAAGELVAEFYAQGGVQDPVRALARAQAWAAVNGTADDWAYFAVFGSPTCTSP